MEKIKELTGKVIKWIKDTAAVVITTDSEYEPLVKCRKAFIYSMVCDAILVFTSVFVTFTDYELAKMLLILFLISFILSIVSFVNCGKINHMLRAGTIKEVTGLVIKYNRLNRRIVIVTEEEESYEMTLETDLSVKKNVKYKINYYEQNDELVVTHVIQVSGKEKVKEND